MTERPVSPPPAGQRRALFSETEAGQEALAYCADQSKQADRALWRAVHYAPPPVRSSLYGLHALTLALERIPQQVSEPALGQLRLAWWNDTVRTASKTASAGPSGEAPPSVQGHPAMEILAPGLRADPRLQGFVSRIIETTGQLFEPARLNDRPAIDGFFRATHGLFVRAQLCLLDIRPPDELAGKAQELACLYGFWRAASRPPVSQPRDHGALRASDAHARDSAGAVGRFLTSQDADKIDWGAERARFDALCGELSLISPQIAPELMPAFAPFSLIPLMIKQARRRAQGAGIPEERSFLWDHLLMTRTALRGKFWS